MIRGGSLVYIKIREKGGVVNGYDQKDLIFRNQQRAEIDIIVRKVTRAPYYVRYLKYSISLPFSPSNLG